MARLVHECLPDMQKALGSIPSAAQTHVWWCMPAIPAITGEVEEKDLKSKPILGYIVSLRLYETLSPK